VRDDTNFTFYATAAQVIPVLMIVLVFEAQATTRNLFGTGLYNRILAFVVVVLASLGELAALTVLATEEDGPVLHILTSQAIFALLAFVTWYALPYHRHDDEGWSTLDRRREPPSASGTQKPKAKPERRRDP